MTAQIKIGKPMQMGIENTTFGMERMSAGMHPHQDIRELTQNAFEATAKRIVVGNPKRVENLGLLDAAAMLANASGVRLPIVWGAHPEYPDNRSIWDNGCGMSAADLDSLLHLFDTHTNNDNFGIGIKISTFMRNPAGTLIETWQGCKCGAGCVCDRGWEMTIAQDTESAKFGGVAVPGTSSVVTASRFSCPFPDGFGTRITLFGTDPDISTLEPPAGDTRGDIWIKRQLNLRFAYIPDHVELLHRTGPHATPWERDDRRTGVLGNAYHLRDKSKLSGVQTETDDKGNQFFVHWWCMPQPIGKTDRGAVLTPHLACLYKGELFHVIDDRREATKALDRFNVRRTVIYVEPLGSLNVSMDVTRSNLMVEGSPIQMLDIAQAFAANMPPELYAEVWPPSNSTRNDQRYAAIGQSERLKIIEDAEGSTVFDPEQAEPNPAPSPEHEGKKPRKRKKRKPAGSDSAPISAAPEIDDPPNPRQGRFLDNLKSGFKVSWEEVWDLEEDIAARFTDTNGLWHLILNAQFAPWANFKKEIRDQLTIDRWAHYVIGDDAEYERALVDEIEFHYVERLLYEIAAAKLHNWDPAAENKATEPEALTRALLPNTDRMKVIKFAIQNAGFYRKMRDKMTALGRSEARGVR